MKTKPKQESVCSKFQGHYYICQGHFYIMFSGQYVLPFYTFYNKIKMFITELSTKCYISILEDRSRSYVKCQCEGHVSFQDLHSY